MIIYVVKKGDTLSMIARRYGTTVAHIASANELSNIDQLVIGQALVIPIAAKQHTVKRGETLWRIAKTYGVPIETIIQANQLTNPNSLQIGTVLIIPPRIYTVQPGDTLWAIAQRFGTTSSLKSSDGTTFKILNSFTLEHT